jgi:CRISPR-associated endonuclease/helicase Cas3
LGQIGWPGGQLTKTDFAAAFATGDGQAFSASPFQQAVAEASVGAQVVIVEGPMGSGKTEAALHAAQGLVASGEHGGLYFALPTQVTSNRIHRRVEQFLRNSLVDSAAFRLAHGNAWLEDNFDLLLQPAYPSRNAQDSEDVGGNLREARSWFASAKQALLAPYGVGTVDQALQAVVAVKHFFVRRFALAGKVVILDEVHSYDIYTGTLITALIRELVALRCSVIVLSATLTAARRRELLEAAGVSEIAAPAAYPLVSRGVSGEICQHSTPEWNSERRVNLRCAVISETETLEELMKRAGAGQHVLWIRNTVVEAQQALLALSGAMREGDVRVGLLHSRFPFQRRAELENDWLERLGRTRCEAGGSILIATQVVEQSVDIDLDFIVSDLAPTDMLLQRLGRLWRHERPHRKTSEATFWIRTPEFSEDGSNLELKRTFGRTARVYAPYVLLRTAEVWRRKSVVTLPGDIRGLLEATYSEPAESEPRAWKEIHAELEAEKAILAANATAATLVLGRPMLPDAEEVLTRRKGAPTTPVLLLKSLEQNADGSHTAEALDGSTAEISEVEWRKASARFIHRWTVRTPAWMVPGPPSPARWLDLHGPSGCVWAIVSHDGTCILNGEASSIQYTPALGVFNQVSKARKATLTESHDDDEFDY